MVRPTAPSTARLKTEVVKDGQELLNTESFLLMYSSTKASWENEERRKINQDSTKVTKKKY